MRWFHILLLAAAAALCTGLAGARDVPSTLADVRVVELPTEALHTLALIKRGGPYPYRKDASVFGNREKRLPPQPRGYYTEYTVRTPHSRDRGARRIVAGRGAAHDPATSGEYYYTDDHYNTFRRIRE
ncbi:MAG: ribonuclease domain-containing protein [Burkholderiaceae bacterium]